MAKLYHTGHLLDGLSCEVYCVNNLGIGRMIVSIRDGQRVHQTEVAVESTAARFQVNVFFDGKDHTVDVAPGTTVADLPRLFSLEGNHTYFMEQPRVHIRGKRNAPVGGEVALYQGARITLVAPATDARFAVV